MNFHFYVENTFYILTVLVFIIFWQLTFECSTALSIIIFRFMGLRDEFENSPCFFLKFSEQVEEGWDKDRAAPKGSMRGTKQSSPFSHMGECATRWKLQLCWGNSSIHMTRMENGKEESQGHEFRGRDEEVTFLRITFYLRNTGSHWKVIKCPSLWPKCDILNVVITF